MSEDGWTDAWAVLIGQLNGVDTEVTERVLFRWRNDNEERELFFDRHLAVGPVERSVLGPRVAVLDAAGNEWGWFQPPPGAGMRGGYVSVQPNQQLHEVTHGEK